jgi:fructokinase
MNIISIGEVLWDVFENAEHIGGATFNFSAHAALLGHNVVFVSAVGEDDRGQRALGRMDQLGLSTRHVRRTNEVATGHVTVFVDDAGQPDFTIHRPAAYDFPALSEADIKAITALRPDWIYFGTLAQLSPQVRGVTKRLLATNPHAHRFYDVNLRKDSFHAPLIRELMERASVLKINEDEVHKVLELLGEPRWSVEDFCRICSKRYGWEGVCVTRGAAGCAVFLGGEYVESPGYTVEVVDTVGAGDAFAAAFIHGVNSKWPVPEIADFANRLGAFVASREGAVPHWTMEELDALSR